MYIKPNRYGHTYETIITAARVAQAKGMSTCPVLLIVSMDVDALCGCKILQYLLKQDSIKFRVIPVPGWKELSKITEQIREGNSGYREVVLFNLGGQVNLWELFDLPRGVRLHVIDSHRPYSLENLFESGFNPEDDDPSPPAEIIVWDDDVAEDEIQNERDAYEAIRYVPDTDSEGSSDESEDELGIGCRRRDDSDEEEDLDEEDVGSDGEVRPGGRKRKKKSEEDQVLTKRQRHKYRARIRKYYESGVHFGQSVACQLYLLATLRGCEDNDLLWLGIIGLTYQFTSSLIDRESYDAQATLFQREVDRINIISEEPADPQACQVKLSGPDDRNIRNSEELRFMLFRHWNLYDSMFHSGYVAGKLKLWRERGRKNLQGMFAKMGYSLSQCQQSYAHMDMDLKRTLRSKVESIAPEYGLFDLSFASFVRAYGYQSVLSASDCVESINAVLEVATGVKLDFHALHGGNGMSSVDDGGQGGTFWDAGKGVKRWTEVSNEAVKISDKENTRPDSLEASENAAKTNAAKKPKEDAWWVENFWMASDALSTDPTFLKSALPLSMALQKSIIRQGTSMLDKQAIKTLRSFRLGVIKDGPDLHVFSHPATLTRLGVWLVDAVRDLISGSNGKSTDQSSSKKKPKSFPFVIASLDEIRDCYLVVGVNGAAQYGDVRRNKFGMAFQEAAQISGARARHDRFEESVIEVRKDDLMSFVQKLHLGL